MNVRKINKNELLEVCKLSSICFEYPFNPDHKKEEDLLEEMLQKPKNKGISYWEKIYGAFNEEDSMLSCLNVVPFNFQYDGAIVPATGIGNVCTYPHHRKKGAIKAIFKKILPQMYQNGVMFSYLYPFSEGFYRKFGYERIPNSTFWDLDLTKIPLTTYDGSFTLYTEKEQLEDFKTAYHTFASRHNLMVIRDAMDWANIEDAKASYNNRYAYLYKDKDGTPRGYFVFKKEFINKVPTLKCREFIFDGPETLQILLSFASTYAGDFKKILFYAPSFYNLSGFCKDYPQSSNSCYGMAANGMVRVVNVREVLLLSKYQGSGSLTIKITDDDILQNSHTFKVKYCNGKAEMVEITQDTLYDIAMTVSAFSPAICGALDTRDLYYTPDIQIHCDIIKLSPVFYKKPCWINDYF